MLHARSLKRGASVVAGSALAVGALHFSNGVPEQIFRSRLDPATEILESHEGPASHVMVTDAPNGRFLWLNSQWVASSAGPHSAFGLLPGLFVRAPRHALGIALGTGQTFAAALEQGVEHLDCVDIDAGVIALQAWSAGTSNLYSREFYEEAASALETEGALGQWIPLYGQGVEETRAMVRTGLEVFGHGSLWLTGRDAVLILSKHKFEVSLETLSGRISARGLEPELMRFPANGPADLLAFLLLADDGLARWSSGATIIEDDRPFSSSTRPGRSGPGSNASVRFFRRSRARSSRPLDESEPRSRHRGAGAPFCFFAAPVKIFFGTMQCTPLRTSTTWLTRQSAAIAASA